MLQALQDHEIDMIYYVGRNPDFAEKHGFTLTNAAWTYSLMAVTDEQHFNENEVYTVAVPGKNEALNSILCSAILNGDWSVTIRFRMRQICS